VLGIAKGLQSDTEGAIYCKLGGQQPTVSGQRMGESTLIGMYG